MKQIKSLSNEVWPVRCLQRDKRQTFFLPPRKRRLLFCAFASSTNRLAALPSGSVKLHWMEQ